MFLDVNGDGLPDRVIERSDGSYDVRFNTGFADQSLAQALPAWDPGAGQAPEIRFPTLGAETGTGWNAGFQTSFGLASMDVSTSHFSNSTTDLLTDVDGDGLVDVVQPGLVSLQQGRTAARPDFSFAATKMVDGFASQPKPSEELAKSLKDSLHPSDALLEWIAPYDGTVDVTGTLALPGRSPVDPSWDGVRLRLYRVDGYAPSTTAQLGSDVALQIAKTPALAPVTLTGVHVSRGTRLYFILSTLADFPVDPSGPSSVEQASFAPNVVYTAIGDCPAGVCQTLSADQQAWADPTGAGVFAFDAGYDFKLAGAPLGAVVIPSAGQLSISATLTKRVSSDDVRACIQKFSSAAIVKDVPCAASGDFVLVGPGVVNYDPADAGSHDWSGVYQVGVGEKLVFRIESDLPIDPASVTWDIQGAMTQVCNASGGSCRTPEPAEQTALSFVGEPYLELHVPLDPAASLRDAGSLNPDPNPLQPYVVPEDGTLTIDLAAPDPSAVTFSSPVWLTARNASGYFVKQALGGAAQSVTVSVTRGELIYFEAHSETPFSMVWSPTVTQNEVTQVGGVDFVVNASFDHLEDGQGQRIGVRSVFGGGFHGWHYGAWHGANDQAFVASLFELSAGDFSGTDAERADAVQNGPAGTAVKLVEPLLPRHHGTYFSPTRTGLAPNVAAYVSRDGATFVTATTLNASREGGFVQAADGSTTTIAALLNPGKAARAGEGDALSGNVGISILHASIAKGHSRQTAELVDLNGDRVLDTVGGGGGAITDIHTFQPGNPPGTSGAVSLRESDDLTISIGLGLSAPVRSLNSDGIVQAVHGMYASIGGGVGVNLSTTRTELVDVNGDGLPDSVEREGNCFNVRLNLGGHFAKEVDCIPVATWRVTPFEKFDLPAGIDSADELRHTTAMTAQVQAGGGLDPEIFNASVSSETSVAATGVMMVDLNGDGLPDYVRKSATDGKFYVQVNYGYGFGPEQEWNGIVPWPAGVTKPWLNLNVPVVKDILNDLGSGVDSLEANGTYDELPTIGFAFTYSQMVGLGTPWLNITVGADATVKHVSGFELGLVDIDGDGLVDHVLKSEPGDGRNDQIWVRLNRQGKANLLKHVDRPLGGSVELDYARAGNTYDMPESRWVLSKVIVRDGRGGAPNSDQVVDGHDLQSSYAYALGKYDRSERDFLGFGSVTRTDVDHAGAPQRRVVQAFHNESFAVKGLLEREELWDASERLFTATQDGYQTYEVTQGWTAECELRTPFFLAPGDYCRSFFTGLAREEKRFYEGRGAPKAVPAQPGLIAAQTFTYDQYGNVQGFADLGDASGSDAYTADDLFATVGYATSADATRLYFVGKPTSVEVRDAAKKLLRKRSGGYDGRGNLTTLTSWVDTSRSVDSKLFWTAEGNLREFQGPDVNGQRHTFDYGYDETKTYVTRIEDRSLGYVSTAKYDPSFGEPTLTVDENGNAIQRSYDSFGRLQALAGPYDSLSAPTVSVVYDLRKEARYARTSNKHPESGTVDTVVLVDGLKRVIQTWKTAEVEGKGIGWSVSGQEVYDALGRVVKRGQTFFEPGSSPYFVGGAPLNPTSFTYDVLGRTVVTREPNGDAPGGLAETSVVYDFGAPAGNAIQRLRSTVTDPLGNAKVLFRDPRDEVVAVQENTGKSTPTTSYQYDPLGQLLTVTDAQGHQTGIAYDWLGRRTSLSNPDAGLVNFFYDAAGNLVQKQDSNLAAKHARIGYEYVYDQLRTVRYPFSSAVTYEYGSASDTVENQVGRVKRIVDDAGAETRGYGKLGETVRSTRTVRPLKPNGSPQTFETRFAFDSFGRMTSMVYPDGEVLGYHYDAGGLVAGASGNRPATKHYAAARETYLASLTYDEFEQRKTLVYGNGGTSRYTYDPLTRRLRNLDTIVAGRALQRVTYAYDLVGNVTGMTNALGQATGPRSGAVSYSYSYDKLYRLTDATGTAFARPGVIDAFRSHFDYDDIHNMTVNRQVHTVRSQNGGTESEAYPPPSNHDWLYQYDPAHPHQATRVGDTLLTYDANGNTTRECRDHGDPTCTVDHDHLRELFWNEENRLTAVIEGGGRHVTSFLYDAAGERIVKQGRGGDSITIGQFFNLKGKTAATKHVFVGETRLASKLLPPPGWVEGLAPANSSTTTTTTSAITLPGCDPSSYSPQKCPYLPGSPPVAYAYDDTVVRPETYYYHPDHLGSTSWVTDQNGKVHEHVEYYPYGEVWWEPKYDRDGAGVKGQQFLFTSKELDEETGLYYFGARYYDPRQVRWKSADPLIVNRPERLNRSSGEINPYGYAASRPTRLIDPDGRAVDVSGMEQNRQKWLQQAYEATGIKWKINEKGQMVAEGKRDPKVGSEVAAEVMTRAVESKDHIKIDLVNRSPWVLVDSYFTNRVDVGDLESVAKDSPELRAAMIAHFIEERVQGITIDKEQSALDPRARFDLAHEKALRVEAKVFGATTRHQFDGQDSYFFRYVDAGGKVNNEFLLGLDPIDRTPSVAK